MVSRISPIFSDRGGEKRHADRRLVRVCNLKSASVAKTEDALKSNVSVSVPISPEAHGTAPRLKYLSMESSGQLNSPTRGLFLGTEPFPSPRRWGGARRAAAARPSRRLSAPRSPARCHRCSSSPPPRGRARAGRGGGGGARSTHPWAPRVLLEANEKALVTTHT